MNKIIPHASCNVTGKVSKLKSWLGWGVSISESQRCIFHKWHNIYSSNWLMFSTLKLDMFLSINLDFKNHLGPSVKMLGCFVFVYQSWLQESLGTQCEDAWMFCFCLSILTSRVTWDPVWRCLDVFFTPKSIVLKGVLKLLVQCQPPTVSTYQRIWIMTLTQTKIMVSD